ncbi:SHC-transforming protein 1 [Holothuria leucospilota]|uniref:SHC-transforming protein 1 n=1 Tax=Holothuria leucospilota TaxID=206669 RepID=A0A9Q1BN59_HOLLE|nr:SHC-transforming protein 1 [Holothuria leucospilota]
MAGIIPNFRKKGPNTVGQRTNDELWTRTGTFINKPVHGWLHPEEKLKHGGICYGVRIVWLYGMYSIVHPYFQINVSSPFDGNNVERMN